MGNKKLESREFWQKIYKTVFWVGYLAVFSTTFIRFGGDLHKLTIKVITFRFHFDQVLHAVVYMLIMLYYPVGQYYGFDLFRKRSFKKYLLVILLLASITEFAQLFVPYRSFNIFDMAANFTGVLLGVVIIRLMRGKLYYIEK